MSIIVMRTLIAATLELVFDLSRSIDLHLKSTAKTNERVIAGKTNGFIGNGETVTWRARHFGVYQNFTSKITQYDRPYSFTDEMQQGAFQSFRHIHTFEEIEGVTKMTDKLEFQSPLGILGRIVDFFILKSYLTKFISVRNALIKKEAELQVSLAQ